MRILRKIFFNAFDDFSLFFFKESSSSRDFGQDRKYFVKDFTIYSVGHETSI